MTSSINRIIKNSLFLYALTFSNYLIGFLLYPYLSRVLSVERFGLIGFSTSICLIFQMIVEYGFQISTTATISMCRDDKNRIGRIISTMTAAKMILAAIATFGFIACVLLVPMVQQHLTLVTFFYIDALVKAFLPDAYFRGIEQMKAITVRTVIAKSGILLATLFFVKTDADLIIYPLSMMICDTVALIWAFLLIKHDGIQVVKTTQKEIIESIKASFWFFVSRISVSINGSLGSIFLGLKFLPASVEMGIYSGATRISSAGEQLIPPVGDALYPFMVRNKDYRMFYKVVMLGGIIWFAGCLSVFILAEPLCTLILGQEYAMAGQYLRILVIGVFFGFFSFIFGYTALSPLGKAKYANIAIMVSACVNVTACIILWVTGSISVLSVCLVFSSTNIVTFLFRFIAFMRFRHIDADNTSNLTR